MIYTTYFGNLRNLPKDIIPISICGKVPDWYDGIQYKKLAPKFWFFNKYKEDNDEVFYTKQYYKEVLSLINPKEVLDELLMLSNNKNLALVCYESYKVDLKVNPFCHRHLVRDWLNKNNIECEEWFKPV